MEMQTSKEASRHNIQEETMKAVRLVKDYLIQSGELKNVVTNKHLIQMCSDAHLTYLSEQGLKRKEAEKEKVDKDKAQREEAAAVKERKKSCETETGMKFVKTTISVVDKSVAEGNLAFQACMMCTSLNRNRLEQAQAKMDMGLKCKAALELQLTDI